MRLSLFRLLFFITLLGGPVVSYGQAPAVPGQKAPEPLYILNANIIVNGLVVGHDPKMIKSITIHKNDNAPDTPILFKGLTARGIIAINYNGKVRSRSFAKLGRQHGARAPFRVVINGYRLDATQQKTLRIAPEAVGQVRVTPATATSEALMDIQLAEFKPTTTPRPPGTIMIRGVVQN